MRHLDFISLGIRMHFHGGVPTGIDWQLEGPIRKGDKFVWEPLDSDARAFLTVTDIEDNCGSIRIWTIDDKGKKVWNDVGGFRESCVRIRKNNELGDSFVTLFPIGIESQG